MGRYRNGLIENKNNKQNIRYYLGKPNNGAGLEFKLFSPRDPIPVFNQPPVLPEAEGDDTGILNVSDLDSEGFESVEGF